MTAPSRILLVEDNEINRDMLVRRLERAGHHIMTASDGEQALISMRKERPDLVLMDMNLPIKDGWTACKEAQYDSKLFDIPIIALTAHAMAEDKTKAIAAGCKDYATKPVDFPDLLEKISRQLDADH